jgi:CheY-like chemotaxis protein
MEQRVTRVFVRVVGFTDVERHALNTVFRLSESRDTVYSLWLPEAPSAPKLALIDGQSYEARLELASPHADPGMKLIWVGAGAPAHAWRSFERPLQWSEVVQAMDELYAPPPALDLDLGLGLDEPAPPAAPDTRRALILEPVAQDRLYLRAKLASVGLLQADEAATGAEALALCKTHTYEVALLSLDLPDQDGWQLVRELLAARPRIAHLIVTAARNSMSLRLRARLAGVPACLGKPPHPGRLQRMLERIQAL